jgi:hypothetical protein
MNVLHQTQISDKLLSGEIVSQSGKVCAYTVTASHDVAVWGLSEAGEILWQSPLDLGVASFVDTGLGIKSQASGCYALVDGENPAEQAFSKVTRFDANGIASGSVTKLDFRANEFEVVGRDVYQTGISGEYDGSLTFARTSKSRL